MNELVTMTEKEIVVSVSKIKKATEKIDKGYMSIINELGALRMSDAHKAEMYEGKYKTFAQFCTDQFGLSKATLYNLLKIFDEYSVNGKVPEEIASRGTRPLLAEIKEKEAAELKDITDTENNAVKEDALINVADGAVPFSNDNEDTDLESKTLVFPGVPEFEAWLELSKENFLANNGRVKTIVLTIQVE